MHHYKALHVLHVLLCVKLSSHGGISTVKYFCISVRIGFLECTVCGIISMWLKTAAVTGRMVSYTIG